MVIRPTAIASIAAVWAVLLPVPAYGELTDAEIVQRLIEDSINSYSGKCACLYSTMRSGSQCGGRSAWSKPGGADRICYPDDVTPQMIKRYRATH